jgi:uncharacterized membrane protein
MTFIRIAIIAGLILTFLVPLAAYPVLPNPVVSHWNAAGEPDGSMGKLAGIGLVPLIMVALVALLLFSPDRSAPEKLCRHSEGAGKIPIMIGCNFPEG